MKKNEKNLTKSIQLKEVNFQHVDCESSRNFKKINFSSTSGKRDADESQQWTQLILKKKENCLEGTIAQAQEQYRMMEQLFQAMEKAQRGEITFQMKSKRRCAEELAVRFECSYEGCHKFYSVESTLQRHIKLKHYRIKSQPPPHPPQQLVNEFQLDQHLTPDIYESMEDSLSNLCSPQILKNAS